MDLDVVSVDSSLECVEELAPEETARDVCRAVEIKWTFPADECGDKEYLLYKSHQEADGYYSDTRVAGSFKTVDELIRVAGASGDDPNTFWVDEVDPKDPEDVLSHLPLADYFSSR